VKRHLFLTCICLIILISFIVPPVPAAERGQVVVITPAPVGTTAVVVRGITVPDTVGTTATVPEGCSCLLPSEAAARFGTYAQCAGTGVWMPLAVRY